MLYVLCILLYSTWEDDTLHPGVSLQELGSSHGGLEVPLHPQVQCLQSTVTQVAVEGRRDPSQCCTEARGKTKRLENTELTDLQNQHATL